VPADGVEDLPGSRREVRVGVDLPVRVRQGDADLLAVVLERVHVGDTVDSRELRRPLGPDVDDEPGPVAAQLGEDPPVVVGEADDLAPAEPGPQLGQGRAGRRRRHVRLDAGGERGEAVLEDHDLVGVVRDLGGAARPGGAQRALVGRGQERAGLPVRGDDHPLVEQRIVAQLGTGADRRQVAGVLRVVRAELPVLVEVEDLPAIGQPATRPDHAPASPPSSPVHRGP
jgi:hypothetical protein